MLDREFRISSTEALGLDILKSESCEAAIRQSSTFSLFAPSFRVSVAGGFGAPNGRLLHRGITVSDRCGYVAEECLLMDARDLARWICRYLAVHDRKT